MPSTASSSKSYCLAASSERIELTPDEAKTLGEALMKPAPKANAHLTKILKNASKW